MTLLNYIKVFPEQSVAVFGLLLMAISIKNEDKSAYRILPIYILTCFAALGVLGTSSHTVISPLFFQPATLRYFLIVAYLFALIVGCWVAVDEFKSKQEVLILMLASLCGFHVLICAKNILIFYLGLELLSFPMYSIVGLSQDSFSEEAAFKYYVQGSFSSACFLFGASWLYGMTGSLDLATLLSIDYQLYPLLSAFAMSFFILVILFKLGVIPFHFWVADVYDQSQASLILWLSVIPKMALLGILSQIPAQNPIKWLIFALFVISSAWGNLAALTQNRLQRLIGYASLAQTSFAAIPTLVSPDGVMLSVSYIIVYCMGLIAVLWSIRGEDGTLESLKELRHKAPVKALLATFGLLSLAGLPPFPGFFPKVAVFLTLIQHEFYGLAILMAGLTVISLAYYLSVITKIFEQQHIQNTEPTF